MKANKLDKVQFREGVKNEIKTGIVVGSSMGMHQIITKDGEYEKPEKDIVANLGNVLND